MIKRERKKNIEQNWIWWICLNFIIHKWPLLISSMPETAVECNSHVPCIGKRACIPEKITQSMIMSVEYYKDHHHQLHRQLRVCTHIYKLYVVLLYLGWCITKKEYHYHYGNTTGSQGRSVLSGNTYESGFRVQLARIERMKCKKI